MLLRIPRTAAVLLAAATLSSCDGDPTEPAFQTAAPVTLEWQAAARGLVAERSMSPLAAGRLFAAVGIASMRAVAAADAATPASTAGGRNRYEARRGAVAGASAKVLAYFVPSAAADLNVRLAAQGSAATGGPHAQFTQGVAIGSAAADAVITHVTNDGFTAAWTGSIPVGAGMWTTSSPPAGVTLGAVKPYFLTSNSQFRPPPPPAYLSAAFNADLANVASIAANLTAQQRAIALAWAYGGGTYTPLGYWNELGATYVAAAGMDEAAAAKVFGLMGAAVFDNLIATFEAKYHFWLLRPHQANPAIVPVFTTPNYPAYASGHGGVSSASARVLAHFFPARKSQLDVLVEEAALSRIYAGIHYTFDMTAAKTQAEKVADWVIANGK